MIEIAKKFEFSASHSLERAEWDQEKNQRIYGKCANPNGHGHNYTLEVVVTGELDPEHHWLIDASKHDAIVQEQVFRQVDHKNLNRDVPWLAGKVPTSEVIVDAIWHQLEGPIHEAAPNARLSKLVLHETSRIYAVRTANEG